MWKLLILLGAGMFLTMLIGGQDRGQVRQGLMNAPEPSPAVTSAAFDPDKIVPEQGVAAPVELVTFVPVAPPAPAIPATPAPAPVVEAAAPEPVRVEPAPPTLPVRYVNAGSINLRSGPSTNNAVIGRLTRNEAVSIVGDAGDGWVLIRIEGDGAEGYVAARLLTEQAP